MTTPPQTTSLVVAWHGQSRARGAGASVGWVAAGGYLSLVVGANWASAQHLLTLGALAIPAGACVAGLVFTVRDVLHEAFGLRAVLAAIAAGTVLSAVAASPRIAVASAAAFALAERLHGGGTGEPVFGAMVFHTSYPRLRNWINGPAGQRLGLTPIPAGPLNLRMLRRTLAQELAQRPGGLLAAKIHLKHVSTATTEGYANRPGGSQALFHAEVQELEEEHHLRLTIDAFRQFQAGQLPAGLGARDLTATFTHIDNALRDSAPAEPTVLDTDRRIENLLRAQAASLHVGPANYCWFRDPSKALCLRLAGTTEATRPLIGLCDSARCPQVTHHACHRPIWAEQAATFQAFLGNPRVPTGEKTRLRREHDRVQRVLDSIDEATSTAGSTPARPPVPTGEPDICRS
ncbi:hypothetical protein [Amycolatopsis magusensis]|uniref:Uncharacterized protein n=1 Tax=Amycolatopsis magusensis TaxID=882444 RepID=A0ABS4PVN9_9PSEU|nr:hypothetical protein [Amycolatopsis magusensis]MBP2182919.1 hypothetical protein [Amycolatopsis magusensis]